MGSKKRAEKLFDLIWETETGLGNILVNDFSSEVTFEFVRKWQQEVVNRENKEASDDLLRSICICPEVSCFTSIMDSVPATFAHCVIRNNVVYHKDIFGSMRVEPGAAENYSNNDDNVFLACLESTAAIPIANSETATADIVYNSNNWIHTFRLGLAQLITQLVDSEQYDEDVRLVIPVLGLDYAFAQYLEILKAVKETGLADRVCYVVHAEQKALIEYVTALMYQTVGVSSQQMAQSLIERTFTHVIE